MAFNVIMALFSVNLPRKALRKRDQRGILQKILGGAGFIANIWG
jgi:hypothetical protein